MKIFHSLLSLSLLTLSLTGAADVLAAEPAQPLVVDVKHPGADVASTMYGIFFEDINFGADGGLYAEMVKNRSFEFPQSLMGWRTQGNVEVRNDGPFERCPHYVRMSRASHPDRRTTLFNDGFFGYDTQADSTYRFSLWARCPDGGRGSLRVQIAHPYEAPDQVISEARFTVEGAEWRQYTATLKARRDCHKGELRIQLMTHSGTFRTVDVEHVSLFPAHTWQGRSNGLRADLVKALADLKPGVFRFPGGCIVEGADLATRYQWKLSVGPVENRPINENRWNYTFSDRLFPDYFQSLGLGFFEFFQLAEDLGAQALPVVSCGMACQYQNRYNGYDDQHPEGIDPHVMVPLDSLQPYIDDALDLIEFANGDTATTWGRVRAQMGHPEPFGLKLLGVGNEQWDYADRPLFTTRLRLFSEALRKAHPEIQLVGTVGPNVDDERFNHLRPLMKEIGVDLYDEHYYRDDEWFRANAGRYDKYDRKGPRVFAGEYACHSKDAKLNHYLAAISEAAMMTGFERNADLVRMATYAPLFAHREGWQWRPDLIWFDNRQVVRSCSYEVQQLFAHNRGTHVLPLTQGKQPVAGQDSLYASAVLDREAGEVVVKIVNGAWTEQTATVELKGLANGTHTLTQTTFSCPDIKGTVCNLDGPAKNAYYGENTFEAPDTYRAVTTSGTLDGRTLNVRLAPQSVLVVRVGGCLSFAHSKR